MPSLKGVSNGFSAPAMTRYDLIYLEKQIESLADNVSKHNDSISTLSTELSRLCDLCDNLEQIYKSIDGLTKVIEKLPEMLPNIRGE